MAETSPVHAIAMTIMRGTARRRRRTRASASKAKGSAMAQKTDPLLEVGTSFATVEGAEVLIVSVVTAEVDVGVKVTEGGAKVQLTFAGSEPHEKVTVPV